MPGLCKSERLRNRKDIHSIFQHGKLYRGKRVNLIVRKSAEGRKFAFTVAKGSSGAVERNLIKRRLREACRRQKQIFPRSLHYLFIGKAGIITSDFESLQKEIAEMALKVAKHGSDSP